MSVNWEWRAEFQFLMTLRASGVTNMFGATPYLVQAFGHDNNLARKILGHWMTNFEEIAKELGE